MRSVGEVFETKYSYRGQNTGAMERSFEVSCFRYEAAQEKLKDGLGLFHRRWLFNWVDIVGRIQ